MQTCGSDFKLPCCFAHTLFGSLLPLLSYYQDTAMKGDEPNPPAWPEATVKQFRPSDSAESILEIIRATEDPWNGSSYTSDKHFSNERTVLFFHPGNYEHITENFEIGYYVQMAGLGKSAKDVVFGRTGGPFVPALNRHLHRKSDGTPVGTCLDTFWRAAENFSKLGDLQWAVSQAAPLRRIEVGDLILHDGSAFASGGHLANAKVSGYLRAGGQQQYLVRNVELQGGATGGAWSMVYAGITGKVPTADNPVHSIVDRPRLRVEKPFVAVRDDGMFELRVPKALGDSCPDYTTTTLLDGSLEDARDFARVKLAKATDNVTDIQKSLDQGKDVVLSPGIYQLSEPLALKHPNQVLLGLGLATLVAPRGMSCVIVNTGLPGVRVAGIMLEASESQTESEPLLEWGRPGDPGDATNPGAMIDVFVRVGGATFGDRSNYNVSAMMRIHSGHVFGDNLWIWRADHAVLGPNETANYPHISPIFWQSEECEYRVKNGIEVTGNDVTIYGLAVEHANEHQTVWTGDRGEVVFYQCEFPYGVSRKFAEKEFRGYLIGDSVNQHTVVAPGIYSNFRNDTVHVSTAIEHPVRPEIHVVNPFTVRLDNQGSIRSVVNGKGGVAEEQGEPVRLL